jgi:light-regulated signal transduction histidine kinase (bacteriophytochrome)
MHRELSAELPKVVADRVQLQQVFMNLMLNVIEAMEDSGRHLTVTSGSENSQLLFSVSDTSVGLPTKRKRPDILSLLYCQAPRKRNGAGHQSFHCGIAWRPVMGNC